MIGLTTAIGHHIWIKFSGRPYRHWYHKFCKGDWFVSLQLNVERVKSNFILPSSAQQSVCPSTLEHRNLQTWVTGVVSSIKR